MFLSAGREILPVFVDFFLGPAVYDKRYCLRESELRAAIECGKFLAFTYRMIFMIFEFLKTET
jgi:hypothetical protein